MIALSENTLEKYKQGYKKASTILSDYIGQGKKIIEKLKENEIPEEIELKEYKFTSVNKMITAGILEKVKRQPKGTIKTGFAFTNAIRQKNKLIYCEIFTDTKTGKLYTVIINSPY